MIRPTTDAVQAFEPEEITVPSPPSVITLPIALCQNITITNIDMTQPAMLDQPIR
jgi:hypothetical protein